MTNYSFERATINEVDEKISLNVEPTVKQPVFGVAYTLYTSIIFIDNDGDFVSQGFTGSGTQNNPFLLENHSLTNSSGTLIHIQDTTAYFKISNCLLNALNSSNNAIYLENVINGEIISNIISNCSENGIELYLSSNNTISDNTVYNCSQNGIYLYRYNDNNDLSNNTVYNCSQNGICLNRNNANNNISSNTLYNCLQSGIYFSTYSSSSYNNNNAILDNTIRTCSVGGIEIYRCDNNTILDNKVYNCSVDGIELRYCNNNTISDNKVYNCSYYGIELRYCSNNIISDNLVNSCRYYGILLNVFCDYNTVSNNTVNDCDSGISCSNNNEINSISDNTVYNCSQYGIVIANADNNTISRNTVLNCSTYGIQITSFSDYNAILGNTVYNCSNSGIAVFSSDNNTFSYNFVYNNTYYALWSNTASDNVISWNNFFDNIGGINQVYSTMSFNSFSHNYWNDLPSGGVYTIVSGSTYDYFALSAPAPPGLIIASPFLRYYGNDTITVKLFGYLSLDHWYNIESVDVNNHTWTTTVSRTLPEGTYTLNAYANNSFGSTIHVSSTFTIDTTIPIVDIISPLNITYNQNSVILNYTVSDGTTTIYINGIANKTAFNNGWIISCPIDGIYNITIIAVDQAGNIGNDTVVITIDNPYSPHFLSEPIFLTPEPGIFKNVITIRWTSASDSEGHQIIYDLYYSNDGYNWKLLASDLTETFYKWNISSIPNGLSYRLKLIARCFEGLEVEVISSIFTIDNSSTNTSTSPSNVPGLTFSLIILGALLLVLKKRGYLFG